MMVEVSKARFDRTLTLQKYSKVAKRHQNHVEKRVDWLMDLENGTPTRGDNVVPNVELPLVHPSLISEKKWQMIRPIVALVDAKQEAKGLELEGYSNGGQRSEVRVNVNGGGDPGFESKSCGWCIRDPA
ncbi:hypothetical protein V6N12_068069 [Hibiscus sabdariffa]|uniref:Uncharacterized protein n=1 Tax=Hibiscus sabdariffa TaxID=183260 RepID=A0ABR2FNW8_9ROSI